MAATVSSLREILLTTEPPKQLIDRKTELPILPDELLQRLKKATTREEGIQIAEDAKKMMVGQFEIFFYKDQGRRIIIKHSQHNEVL